MRITLPSSLSGLRSRIGVRASPTPVMLAASAGDWKAKVIASSNPAPTATSRTRSSSGIPGASARMRLRRPGMVEGTRA